MYIDIEIINEDRQVDRNLNTDVRIDIGLGINTGIDIVSISSGIETNIYKVIKNGGAQTDHKKYPQNCVLGYHYFGYCKPRMYTYIYIYGLDVPFDTELRTI